MLLGRGTNQQSRLWNRLYERQNPISAQVQPFWLLLLEIC